MWPKIVQVNKNEVYIIGGNNTKPKFQNNPAQIVLPHTFRISLDDYVVCKRADLNQGR